MVDTWLRDAKRPTNPVLVVQAEARDRRDRMFDGTYRACPYRKDVVLGCQLLLHLISLPGALAGLAAPILRVLAYMACGGYKCLRAPLSPPPTGRYGQTVWSEMVSVEEKPALNRPTSSTPLGSGPRL